MQGTMMDYPLTLVPILERAGRLFGKVEIVSRLPDKSLHRYTYKDFYRRARALAEALQKAGLRRGDRVGTLMWNHYAHLEAYFGIPLAGGVLHTLNLRLHPRDIAYIANHAQDRFLIVDDVLLPLYEQFKDQVNAERVIVVPLTGKPVPEGYLDYEAFLNTATGDFTYPELDENEALGMCYTSGTTGQPKGVVYSHRAVVLHSLASGLSATLGITQRDVVLPVVPMFHVNAWGLPFTAVMVGAKQVFPGPYLDPESLLELFEREQVTFTAGVPTIWLGILQALEKAPDRWKLVPRMRMVVGGSAAPEGLIRAFDRFGLQVVHAWGMTETTPLGTVSLLKSYMEDLSEEEKYAYRAKQGLPVPFVEVRVVNEEGEAPWDGKTMGELQVRGPWVAASYYNLPEAQDRWTEDGWFRTGDVATIDPEGYVKITDRTKDLIKSGGEWISSVDLENALMGHPKVAEAAVIAVPHPRWQERPLAVVVLKEAYKGKVTPEELREFLAPKFAKWWLPDAFVFVDEIPRTSAGKFLKAKLREQFRDWKWD
ncbi:MAG: long-chain fatty acid--CoA ligase [Thermus sp.]|uniref:long-chain fatty acid--CoA ligase n=1 Tax=Thermus sp. TaxID=275 RepID=UPI00331A49C9